MTPALDQLRSLLASDLAITPKTLPQARDILDQIRALLPQLATTASASSASSTVAAPPKGIVASTSTSGAEPAKDRPTDDELLKTFNALKGTERKAFLADNSDALWRAYSKECARSKRW